MKVSTLPQIYRHLTRWREILAVLSKYGLADWLSHQQLDFARDLLKTRMGDKLTARSREERIRLALVELGPTFIKLGQFLGTRPDVVGPDLAAELQTLQTAAPADPPEVARAVVEAELGPMAAVFASFDDQALASASIGQVHRATLPNGMPVVVKVQHPNIARRIRVDLEIIHGLATLAERSPELKQYRPAALVAEMQRTLRRELDFRREERNLEQFTELFKDDETVRVPRPYPNLTTPRVLTMERLDGSKLDDALKLGRHEFDREEFARRGAERYLDMIFVHGVYHADPHPGNILRLEGDVIGLLDFGNVGRLDEAMREDIEDMLLAIVGGDSELLTSLVTRVGQTPPTLDESALTTDLSDFVAHYAGASLQQLELAAALNDVTGIIRRHRIILPTQVGMLIKLLITLEGTARMLNPNFSLLHVMAPFQRKVLARRLSPVRHARKLRRLYGDVEHLVQVLPRRVVDIVERIQTGKLDVHLDHRGLAPSVNRLVLGMLTSALFLGSSLLLSRRVPPVLFRVPTYLGLHEVSILGLAGCIVSVLLGLRLLWAITRSGHLDQKD